MSRPTIDLAQEIAIAELAMTRFPNSGTRMADTVRHNADIGLRMARALRKIAVAAGPKSAIVTRVLAEEGIVVGDEP